MIEFFKRVGLVLLAILLGFFYAFVTGFFIHFLWPYVIPVILPGLVANGTIVAEITILQAFCLSWLINLLFLSKKK